MSSKSAILVTGGAGYIGSQTVLELMDAGYPAVVIDDLSTGCQFLVPERAIFIPGNAGDRDLVERTISEHRIAAVVHLAASVIVSESVSDPLKYYRNNSSNSASLIAACVRSGVEHFVFSSTAAVYGIPERVPVSEDAPASPINPYGRTKLISEWCLQDAAAQNGIRFVSLRYFNVAGADPRGRAGQLSPNATHLIKVASEAATCKREYITIHGTDYDTFDGTCIRDYIHVADIAKAHVAALKYLREGGECCLLNCGYGRGYSVREVLNVVQNEAGMVLDIREGPRREGDPPELVADSTRLRSKLRWEPEYDDLQFIVRSALAWERRGA